MGPEFDDPIVLPDGRALRTLRDAIKYLADTVPKKEHLHPAIVLASTVLTDAAEGRDFMMHAHIATLRAIYRHEPPPEFDTSHKKAHWVSGS